jgi:hypothetical protein
MDSSNQKIRHSADVNLINASIGCAINALIAFPIHIFLSSISSSDHTLHGNSSIITGSRKYGYDNEASVFILSKG